MWVVGDGGAQIRPNSFLNSAKPSVVLMRS